MPENSLSIAAAMTYGDRTTLSYELQDNFRLAGLSHILVVSGLHLSVLSGFLLIVLRKIIKNRYIIYSSVIMATVFYALLCGMRLSIIRAGFVVLFMCIAQMIGRRQDSYTSLGVAALCLTIINPYSAVDLSLLLSLCATLGILFGMETFKIGFTVKKIKVEKLIQGGLTTICAIVATMPIFAAIGDGFSLLAIPVNILCVFLATPIIILTIAGLFASLLPFDFLARALLIVADFLIDFLIAVVDFVSAIAWQFISFSGSLPFTVLIIAFLIGFLVFLKCGGKPAVLSGSVIILCGIIISTAVNFGTVSVAVVGSSMNPVLVVNDNSNTVVIYRGTTGNNNYVEEYLLSKNIRKVDYIIDISHNETSLTLETAYIHNVMKGNYYNNSLKIGENIDIFITKQSGGNISVLQVGDFSTLISSGSVNTQQFETQSLTVGGTSKMYGVNTKILFSRKLESILEYEADEVMNYDSNTVFQIRPETSVKIHTG